MADQACERVPLTIINFASERVATALSVAVSELGFPRKVERGADWLGRRADGPPPIAPVVVLDRESAARTDREALLSRVSRTRWLCVMEPSSRDTGDELARSATEFLEVPWSKHELLLRLERFTGLVRARTRPATEAAPGIVGPSEKLRAVVAAARRAARSPAPVMIQGETGTGKELIARTIHEESPRRNAAFVPVNCACIPESLAENELFGHEPGAYTGAERRQAGLTQQADGGTLFLDEVDALPLAAQVSLLRFLQEGEVRPLGGGRASRLDVKIIAASNRNLRALVADGQFRDDLFYRLMVLNIEVPPLRQRREDIPELARHFLAQFARTYGHQEFAFTAEALGALTAHDWAGNVRELENRIHRAILTADSGLLGCGELDLAAAAPAPTAPPGPAGDEISSFAEAKEQAIRTFERNYLSRLMELADGNVTAAADLAGKERRALGKLLKKHGIGPHWAVRQSPSFSRNWR